MLDEETVIRDAHDVDVTRKDGKRHVTVRDGRTSVTIKDHGCQLVLFFDDPGRQGPLRELRVVPDTGELDPGVLRKFASNAALYVQYARAAMNNDDEAWRRYIRALRESGTTRRGLGEDFYKRIAAAYDALIAEGEPHPVKALAEQQPVDISTASRWIKEARRRGYIKEAKRA
jgi:hypothetical protein